VDHLGGRGFRHGESRVQQSDDQVCVFAGRKRRARSEPVVESIELPPGIDANGHAGADALGPGLVCEPP
jgi:hypothetical protein